MLADRIADWSRHADLNVHKIIALVAQVPSSVRRDELVRQVAALTRSRNPDGAVASLLTNSGNAYGRVLANYDGLIRIHPEVEKQVHSLIWSAG